MASDSAGESFGKVVLGGVVGFALYLVISGLGLGGGRGEGPSTSPPPPLPPQPKDAKRLSFVMVEPKIVGNLAGFRLVDGGGDPKKIYSIDDLIARVKVGSHTDVELRAAGDVIQGSWIAAQDLIKHAGLTIWLAETASRSSAHVGFHPRDNARGHYGRRFA